MPRRPWLVLSASLLPLFSLAACGGNGDDAGDPTSAATTGAATATPQQPRDTVASPLVDGPASKYTILHAEMGGNYLLDIPNTYVLDAKTYGATRTFPSGTDGEALLNQWGYVGGFETSYTPEGRDTTMLNGGYYVFIETHLFKTAAGATSAFEFFQGRLSASKANQPVSLAAVGNEWAAWKTTGEKIGSSQVLAAYHRLLFRRGNLVVVVATTGADPFMKIDMARAIAVLVDKKATGEEPAVAPTPSGN